MLTRCGAKVGTSDIMILLKAFAKLASQPVKATLILSLFSSKIYTPNFSMSQFIYYNFINKDSNKNKSTVNHFQK